MLSISTVIAADADDAIANSNDENLTVQSDINEAVEQSNNDDANAEQVTESEVLSASSDDENELLSASSNEEILGAGTSSQLYSKISGESTYLELDEDYLLSYAVSISGKHGLVIDGKGHTISGAYSTGLLSIQDTCTNITFKNINFINSVSTAIYFSHSHADELSVDECEFNFINCTFENNTGTSGGVIFVKSLYGSFNFINSTVKHNSASNGGFIDVESSRTAKTKLNIENCIFTENSASSNGGVILSRTLVDVSIKSSNFTNNYADGEGGIIRASGNIKLIEDCNFYSNHAKYGGAIAMGSAVELNIYDSHFEDNYAGRGGAILSYGATINNCDFVNNRAIASYSVGTQGGAYYSRSGSNIFSNCNFNDNFALEGGALYLDPRCASFTVIQSTFNSNSATEKGGAIFTSANGVSTVTYTTFNNNSAESGGAIATEIRSDPSKPNVYSTEANLLVQNSVFTNNKASLFGGALYLITPAKIESNTRFSNNNASMGGAIYVNYDNGKIDACTFESNNAQTGVSVYWKANNGEITKSSFNENNPVKGAVYWEGTGGKITSSTFNGTNLIYVANTGSVVLTSNTQTSSSYDGSSVYLEGNASFSLNEFMNAIYNKGRILSQTYMKTLNNITVVTGVNSLPVFSRIEDDNGNTIKVDENIIIFYDNGNQLTTTFNHTDYVSSVSNLAIGLHNFTSSGYNASNFANIELKNGAILYLVMNLTVNQTNYGEKVVFTTTLINTTLNGTIELHINEVIYNVTLINGIAELTLYNMAPNEYKVTAIYDEYNQTLDVNITIDVQLRNSTINIAVNNIAYGEVAIINVTATNGTTGNVYIFVNNKMYTVTLKNSTGQLNLTNLAGGTYTVYAVYNGDVNFNGCNNNTAFTVAKENVTININASDVSMGQTAVIKVKMPSDANGTTYVYIDGTVYQFNKQPIALNVTNLAAGTHTIRVIYEGNDKYLPNTNSTTFRVKKIVITPIIVANDIYVGENATIRVNLNNATNATGLVLLTVNGSNYYGYANKTYVTFNIPNLPYGKYNVTAIYLEDDVHEYATTNSSFKVDYVIIDPVINYEQDEDLNVLLNVTVPADVNGNIVIEVNGTNYTADIVKGKFSVTIKGLTGGTYPAMLYFANDTKYQAVNKPFNITLSKISIQIHINAPNIHVGDNATITVTVPIDAEGNVTITSNNKSFTQKVVNGTAVFSVPNLAHGIYNITAVYSGDRKYYDEHTTGGLYVDKVDPNPYSYINVTNIHVGETATFNITMPGDITGKVNLTMQNKTYTVNVTNGFGQINITGLKAGSPVMVNAYFAGNDKYYSCERNYTAFAVLKISNYPVNITAVTNSTIANNMTANITVKIAEDANGEGYIIIDNKTYDVIYTNGVANIVVDNLTAGNNYTIEAYFAGDDKYTEGSATKTIGSNKTLDYIFEVSADDIFVGQTAVFVIYLPNATLGDQVTLYIPGIGRLQFTLDNETWKNGTVRRPVADLPAGEYNSYVTYGGNNQYESSTRYGTLLVSKINTSPRLTYNTTYVGENLTVYVTLPSDSNGTVALNINNKTYNATVENGTAVLTIPDLEAKTYPASLSYSGNEKYNARTQSDYNIRILKVYDYLFEVGTVDIYVGDNETITIQLPADINGNVTLTIPGTSYINHAVNVVNGNATVKIPGLKAGNYNVTVSVTNSSKYLDQSEIRYFKVSTIGDYIFTLDNVTTVYVRDNITIVVHLPSDATGNVTVNIFGENHTGIIDNGTATIKVKSTKDGTFAFTASFEETGKYNYKSLNGHAVVVKKEVVLNPTYKSSVNVDENITFYFKFDSDVTGNVTVTSRGVTYTAELVNGSANVTVQGYPLSSVYSPSISYTGDDKYYAASGVARITAYKVSDYNITVEVSNITVDDVELVNITIPSDATEDVLVSGNFSDHTMSVKLTNGTATFKISDLPAGTYYINVRYQGYQKYSDKNVTKTFTVSKVVPPISIEFVNNDTLIVKLPDLANGLANITVGNVIKTQINITNGRGSLNVSGLRPGNYSVNATFLGGARYLENSTSINISIPKIEDYILPVSALNITVGENSTITVILPEYANGTVNITIDNGEVISVPVISGKAFYDAANMAVGSHNVTVAYANEEYVFKTNSTKFIVKKIETTIAADISDNVFNLTVNATLTEGVTGNVTITIDGTPYVFSNISSNKINLTVPIIPDEHYISISYSGDENHTPTSYSQPYYISKISDYTINVTVTPVITVMENNVVNITLPKGIEGGVYVFVSDEVYEGTAVINSTTGKATLTLDKLPSGNYTVTVSFESNRYSIKQNFTNFTVIKLNTTISVNVTNITKDLTEVINVTVNENATGYVEIFINNVTFRVKVENGTAVLTRSNLVDKTYPIVVTYLGDENYNSNVTTAEFTVSKIPVNITITANNITVGQEANFTIETSRNITDQVTVRIDNKNYTAVVYNGKGFLIVLGENVGVHNVTVIYAGDNNYLPANDTINVTVFDRLPTAISVNVTNITVGENATIHINVTGAQNGTVRIYMLGNPVDVKITNGAGNYTYTNLTARNYHFTAEYLENTYYKSSTTTGDFTVFKKQSYLTVNVTNIKVGEVELFNITISNGTTGHVLISFADMHLFADINGTTFVSVPVADLPVGQYNVTVKYDGDENFYGSTNKSSFNITKLSTIINITCNDTIIMGHPVEFTITTSANVTAVVILNVDNKNYTTYIVNGKGTYTIYNLITGNYTATVYFPESDKYDAVDNSTDFKVTGKSPVSINVTVANITLGENATVQVTITNGTTGNVTLNIAGRSQTGAIVNGTVNFTVTNLTARDYHVTVTYAGDNNYLPGTNSTDFTVYKKNSTISMNVSNIKVGQHEVINVTVTPGATGIVLIDIAGIQVYAQINATTGIATATFNDLGVNRYNVTATYLGDNNYYGNSTNATFNVTRLTTDIKITCNDTIVVGCPVEFNITTSENITDVIVINVNNQNYTSFIENGKGTFTVYNLGAGNYTATVYLKNNDKYYPVENSTRFNVTGKSPVSITVSVANITLGENATVYVDVNVTTGKVTLNIAGDHQTKDVDSNGKVNFTVSGLSARDYHLTVTYIENDGYLSNRTSANFTVYKKSSEIKLNVTSIKVGDKEIINVTVTKGATGIVLIDIAGVQVYAQINETTGIATATFDDLGVNTYNVTATYLGDDNYNGNSTKASFNVTKHKTSIVINTTANIMVQQTIEFNITTSENITEVIKIEVDKVNYTAYIIEGKGSFILPKFLDVGNYTATVYYLGNSKYGPEQNTTDFKVIDRQASQVIIEIEDVTVGENVTVFITVTPGATGTVILSIAGESYFLELNNSRANYTISNLIARNYHASATYMGDEYYYESDNTTNFVVNKKASQINVTANDITVIQTQTISINITNGTTGVVLIDINGTDYFANITNGVAKLDVKNLAVGQYTVTVKYEGDANYNASSAKTKFNVTKLNSEITLELITPSPVGEGDDVLIKVTGPDDFTGVAIVTVKGLGSTDYTVFINNGEGQLILTNQPDGTYNVSAKYLENDKYLANVSNNVSFEVYKTESTLTVQTHNIYVGENETIIVTVNGNYTDNVTIVIDNNLTRQMPLVYNQTSNTSSAKFVLDERFNAGVHEVHASFTSTEGGKTITHEGDSNFIVSKNNSTVGINTILDIKVGENATITITLDPTDATGNIEVYVGGEKYIVNRTNMTLTLKDLKAGHYGVQVIYDGDDKYLASHAESSFNVTKNNVEVNVDVSNIEKGQVEYVNVTVASDAKGYVLIDINGTKYYAEVIEGVARFNITDLTPGEYDVNATFIGDDKYNSNHAAATFNVSKLTTTIKINGSDIYFGQDEVFNITTSANLTVVVIIEVNGTNYTTFIKQGNGTFTVSKLPVGVHTATVYFNENTDYYAAKDSFTFEVFDKKESSIDINVTSITVGEKLTIKVNVTEGATGDVMIVIAGNTYTKALDNGEATFEIENLTARDYHVSAYYLGDEYYATSNNTAPFTVSKKNTTVIAAVTNSTVGSVEYINVTVDSNASGTILISVGSSRYYGVIENGVAKFNVTGLLVGNYTADITYLGDDNFNNATGKVNITISKLSTLINITSVNITVGQTQTFVIRTSANITDLVKVEIDGVNYTTFIFEGVGEFSTANFTAKEYTVTVYYLGDDVYFPISNYTTFTVSAKKESQINVAVHDITIGDVEYINVTVSEGVTGNITIIVAEDMYVSPIEDGVARFMLSNLSARDYHVTVHFFGNEYYLESHDSANFTVHKKDVTIQAEVTNSTVGSIEYITVTLSDSNASGNVLISVGGAHYYGVIENGVAKFNVTGLLVGNYTADITYLGDDNFNNATGKASLTIRQIETGITITGPSDIMEGQSIKLIIKTTENITSLVTVQVGKVNYTTFISQGSGELVLENLTSGSYTAIVYYAGDEIYVAAKNQTTFVVVAKKPTVINIVVQNITVGETEIIMINVTKGATGNLTIVLAGKEYSKPIDANGQVVFEKEDLMARDYDVTVIYNGDSNYNANRSIAHFIVNKKPSVVDLDVENITVGDTEVINVTVTSGATGVVLINVSGTYYYADLNDGKATFNVAGLKTGEYTAIVTYTGDDTYNRSVASKAFVVHPKITLEAGANNGTVTPITVKVSDNSTGNVTVVVDGTPYSAKVENGTATVYVKDAKPGEQNVTVTYDDGKNPVTQNQTVDIPKVTGYDVNVSAPDIKVGENGTITVKLPEDATGNVTVKVGNQTIPAKVENGTAVVNVSDLPVGSYDVDVDYSGDDKYAGASEKSHINVAVNVPTINAVEELVRGWNSIYDYEAVFLDQFGNALEGVNVTFTVNGETYTVLTEKHGVAKLTTSHLAVGEYNVTSYNPVTGESVAKKLKVVPRLIENKDIVMDFADGTSYKVLVIGDDGNPVGEGEIIDIYVNTIHYVSKTDKNGYAKLKLNLNPKSYRVMAEYKNYKVYNKLVIKQTLKLVKKTITIKKSAKSIVLKAKLKWSSGKAIKGKKIVFKFKGKSYKAKTNSKGIAKVTLKKKVVKKLKKGKSYTYSASYKTNKVKGKIKVKK